MSGTTALQPPPAQAPVSEHRRLHRIISYLFEPSLFSAPLVVLFVYVRRHLFTIPLELVVLGLVVLGAVIPLAYTGILVWTGRISGIFYARRRDRLYFYPMLLACEAAIFLLFAYTTSSMALRAAVFAMIAVSATLGVLTIWHKVSYHLAGLGGALSIAVALIGFEGLLVLPIMALVAYSRRRLDAHTWLEVTIGGTVGIVVSALGFRWFLTYGGVILAGIPGAIG